MKQVPDSLLPSNMFPDDDACAAWLIEMRWPDGFVCPACGHEKGWALRRKAHTFECAGCRRQTSVTAGTILHASKLPLTVWFWAAYLMATHSNGISALQLQKQLGIGSYRSAWLLAAQAARQHGRPRAPLSGLVERGQPSIPEPPTEGKALLSAPNSGTETSQAACGWPKSPPNARTLRRNPPRSRRHRENRRLVRLRCGPRRSPQCPCRREGPPLTSSCRGSTKSSPTSKEGARRLPRAASQASAGLSQCPAAKPARCFPLALPPRQNAC